VRLSFDFVSKDVSRRHGNLQQMILTNMLVRKDKKIEIRAVVSKNVSKSDKKWSLLTFLLTSRER
jgi:hypothetical protein